MLDSNGLVDHSTSLYHGKNIDGNSLTDLSYIANSYLFSLLIVLQKIDW